MSGLDPEFAQKLRTDLKDGLGVVVDMHIRLHENGAMSISAPIGDRQLCLNMLAHATDTIKRQAKDANQLVVPGKDVDI